MIRRKRKKIIWKLIFCLCFFIGAVVFFTKKESKQEISHTTFINSVEKITPVPSPTVEENFLKPSAALSQAVSSALEGTQGTYGIVIENMKTGEYFAQNEQQSFDAGSLYKLWVMATVFEQIQQGKFHENTMLTKDVVKLNASFGVTPDPLEQTTGTVQSSIHDALYNMITISSNNAALLLTDKVKVPEIAKFLKTNGFIHSKLGANGTPPTTTAADIASFFFKLYNNEIVSKTYSKEMISLLKNQKLNEKVPEYLPDGVQIAHKTGELNTFSHDGGIVFTDDGDYIIVVLSESDNPPDANERIALVSKNVYDYFSGGN